MVEYVYTNIQQWTDHQETLLASLHKSNLYYGVRTHFVRDRCQTTCFSSLKLINLEIHKHLFILLSN